MNKILKYLLPIFAVCYLMTEAVACDVNSTKLQENIKTRVAKGAPGVGFVVGILNAGQQEVFSVGRADQNNSKPLNEDSLFEIGSISKTFTTIILSDMVLKKEINLDDPVAKFLPKGVSMPKRNGKEITLLDLATHSSGLPRLPSNLTPKDMQNPYADYSVKNMYDFLSAHKLRRDIGEKTEYSNLGMGLLGHVLALKEGVSYETMLKKRVLEPLQMNNTAIALSTEQQKLLTDGHDPAGNVTKHWDIPTLAGAGAIRSSGKDMMKYLAANMGLTKSALSEAIKFSQKFRREFNQPDMSIGLAWITTKTTEGDVTWHNGGTGGYRSYLGFNKERSQGVVVLANSNDSSDKIGQAILSYNIDSIKMDDSKDITLSDKQLQLLIGDYQLAPNFILTVTTKDGGLFVQATGQGNIPVYATSENEFYYKVVKASITFNKNVEGIVESLVLHQNGDHSAKKIK